MTYNYLSVCNKALIALNEVPFANQTEFAAATGFNQHIKDAVIDILKYIARAEDAEWPFLNATTGTQVLTAGTNTYTINPLALKVDWDSFYISYDALLTDPDASRIKWLTWATYRDNYYMDDLNSVTADDYSKPVFVVQAQNNSQYFVTPKPDDVYTLNYQYFGFSSLPSAYSDVPQIPEQFEDVLLWGIKWYAYGFREDVSNAQFALSQLDDGINTMRRILIPQADTMVSTA